MTFVFNEQRPPLREDGSCIVITKAPNGYIITDGTRGDYQPRHLAVFNHMQDMADWLMQQVPPKLPDPLEKDGAA